MTVTKFILLTIGGVLTMVTLLIYVLFTLSTISMVIILVAAPDGMTITTNDLAFYLLLMVFRKPMEAITTTFLDENIPQRIIQRNEPEASIRQTINIQL